MKKIRILVCSAVFLGFLFINTLFSLDNLSLLIDECFHNGNTIQQSISQIQKGIVEDYDFKNSYIDLNGLYARLSGHRLSNERILLNNDMLTHEVVKRIDTLPLSNSLVEFNECLDQMNIDFLYVQAPYKLDLEETLLPVGIENNAHENASEMVDALVNAGVDVLDLRTVFNRDAETINQYFNLTDHHWNNDGAFEAFVQIMNTLIEKYPEIKFNQEILDVSKWNREVYENLFLGSHGKRVGRYFAGLDDLIVYTPAFKTSMTTYCSKTNTFLKGTFEQVNLVSSFLDEPDYYGENPYHVYIGNNYPLFQHRNSFSEQDFKVLVLKDSFVLPVQALLSTEIASLDVIDPRYYTESTLMEYIDCTNPDLVIMMINPSVFVGEEYFEFGINDYLNQMGTEQELIQEIDAVKVEPKETLYNSFKVPEKLNQNQKYTLRLEGINVLEGDFNSVTVALYDRGRNVTILQRAIDLELLNKEEYTLSFYVPEDASDECELLIYAGIKGKTQLNSIEIENLKLFTYQ